MDRDAAEELRILAGELRRHGGTEAVGELRDALKRAAEPAAGAARESILGMPVKHEGTLRAGIADTVKVAASLGASRATVRITASGPERWRGAASAFENGRWHHPVYGRAEAEAVSVALQAIHGKGFGHGRGWTWRPQESGRPHWFTNAVDSRQGEFDRRADDAAERIARRISGEA